MQKMKKKKMLREPKYIMVKLYNQNDLIIIDGNNNFLPTKEYLE